MYQFEDWAAEVAEISTLPEFQNAHIVLYTPGDPGDLDVDTGQYSGGTDAVLIYDGQARVVGIRSYRESQENSNPTALKPVRVQIPAVGLTLGRVQNNAKAYFIDGGRNAQLVDYIFNVNSDFNSSHVAAYTFELTVDVDAVDDDKPVFAPVGP